jgi:hypothetical protein
MELAVRVFKVIDKPKPDMNDFVKLFEIDIEELYQLDDPTFEDGNATINEFVKDVHCELNTRSASGKHSYSIFRQLAVNVASTDPSMLSCFPPNVKAAHEAAVALLGCLYSLKPTASARALDGTAAVAAPEPVPFNLFGGADDESTAVAAAPEPASMSDLLDATDTLSEAEIEELKLFVPEAGDIVDGVMNRDKIAANLEKLLWKHWRHPFTRYHDARLQQIGLEIYWSLWL